jgi:hypothetical protein
VIQGFIVTAETKDIVLAQIELSQTSKGLPHYWTPGAMEITTGDHVGKWFIPFTDGMIDTVLRDGKKPLDFPESLQLLQFLGGLESRVEISETEIATQEGE